MKFVAAFVVVVFLLASVVAIDIENQEAETIAVDNYDQSREAKVLSPKSAPSSTNRLATNGYASFYGQFPHHAEFYNHIAGNGLFYGSLITANYVLTGAYSLYIHFINNNFDGGSVVLGSQNRGTEIREQRINFTASGINLHPFYEYGSNLYDIATVRLEHGATLNQYVQPIRLPSLSDSRNYDLMEGATFARLYDGSQRYVRNKVMTNIDCNLEHPFLMIYAQHICTDSYIGGAFCHRNSGAALTIEDERGRVQIGITRWMNQCDYNYPNIHVRVSTFRDWISANSDYVFNF